MDESTNDTIRGFVHWLVIAHQHYFGSVERLVSDLAAREQAHPHAGEDGPARYTCVTCGYGFTIAMDREGREEEGGVPGLCQITADPELLHHCTRVRPAITPFGGESPRQPDSLSAIGRAVNDAELLSMMPDYGSPEAMVARGRAHSYDAAGEDMMDDPMELYDYDSIDDFVAYLEGSAEHHLSIVGTLSDDLLRRQEADPDAMEAGQRYCCRDCGGGFVVFGASDGLMYQIGPRGACRIEVNESLLAPCVPPDRPTRDVMVRHLTEDDPSPEGVIMHDPTDGWPGGRSAD